MGLVDFVKDYYYKVLGKKGLYIDKENYKEDFCFLYFDHILMMLAWEIENFSQGYIPEEKIQIIINFKIG